MPNNGSQLINDSSEVSFSSPKRTRPTDKQMGLGTHNLIPKKFSNKTNNKQNT